MAKKIKSDGTEYYYYYQKKKGRKKKRGRKKLPKKKGRSWQLPWDYKILKFNFKKQEEYIGIYHDLEEANLAKKILLKENDNVKFPKKYINNSRKSAKTFEIQSEYVILKKIRDKEKESNVTLLRNEYGKFVEHKTTSDNWAIVDKFPCMIEETFWVYGYNPKNERKDYYWIFDNLIVNMLDYPYNFVRIYLYGNKLIFKSDVSFDFVICKNIQDGIRLYNEFFEDVRKAKSKRVMFLGVLKQKSDKMDKAISEIQEKTGWDKRKICRHTTRA